MLQNQIPFHKIPDISFQGLQIRSPMVIKYNNQFKLNCRNAIKQSKAQIPQLPKLQTNSRPLRPKGINSERSPKIKFIKEVQKEIKIFQNRQKVQSLMRNFSRQDSKNQDKENISKMKSFSKIKVQLQSLEEQREKVKQKENQDAPKVSNSLKIQRKPSEHLEQLPKCRVGKVRYKVAPKTPRNFWQEIIVSQIKIKDENEEQCGTLLHIEAEMSKKQ